MTSNAWSKAPGGLDGGDPADQWDPAIAVSPDGRDVFVGYYSRAAASDDQLDSTNQLINAYGIIGTISNPSDSPLNSDAHSITWGTPTSLTTTAFRQPNNNLIEKGTEMGDYNCASASGQNFYYAFTAGGTDGGAPQIKMAIVGMPTVTGLPHQPIPPSINTDSAGGTDLTWGNTGTFASGDEMFVEYSTASTLWTEH